MDSTKSPTQMRKGRMTFWWLILSAAAAILFSIAYLPLLNKTNSSRNLFSGGTVLEVADFIVTNGTIYTSDDSLPFAESVAIHKGRIIHVGNYSSIKDLLGSETKVLNLEGKIVVPGLIDSHVHLIFGGLQMARVELRGANSKDDFVNKVEEALRHVKHGSWLLGGGWNNNLWGGKLPMASWIDDIAPHNPVWLSRMDGHMGLANSLALKIAGVSNNTSDPVGGAIMRNSDGDCLLFLPAKMSSVTETTAFQTAALQCEVASQESSVLNQEELESVRSLINCLEKSSDICSLVYSEPTGLLIDSAMKLIVSCIPEVSVDERREALLRASSLALTRGVTTVVDFGRYFPGASAELPWEDFSDVYTWADSLGKMSIRVCLFFPLETWSRLHDFIKEASRKQSPWLYLGGVKAFVDGSLGSNSALLYEPYADEPDNYGLQVADLESLQNLTLLADKSGLQVAIHGIGDRANDLILDMYALVDSKNGMRDRRSRIEHAQHLVPSTAARFGELDIIASVQPDHLLDDADSATKKLGLERAQKSSYLFQSLLASGAKLAFGSDWPVVDMYPLRSMQTAMKRTPPGWERAWVSSECINLNDALKAYTIWAAEACFLDQYVGSLSGGKLADFVVLSTDSWDDLEARGSASIDATYVGGIRAFP